MRVLAAALTVILALAYDASAAWKNGPDGNAQTDTQAECSDPPDSTHDWVADHARDLLPNNEKAWLEPHRAMYRLGTEAPDNRNIPTSCNAPNTGYDDRGSGHSVEWTANHDDMFKDRAAIRAQEEYRKAVAAFEDGDISDAAYYLGAMALYIGDVGQYGHTYPDEQVHSLYEAWVGRRTNEFNGGTFEDYLEADSLVRRTPYTAAKRTSLATNAGRSQDDILTAEEMDFLYSNGRPQEFVDSVGNSLNYTVNELRDVLHTFFLNVVS